MTVLMQLHTLACGNFTYCMQLYLADKVQGFSSLEERAIAIQWVFLAQTTLVRVHWLRTIQICISQ